MIAEKLEKNIKKAVSKKFSVELDDTALEHPADILLGDYATSIAFKLSSMLDKNPKEIADELAKELNKKKSGEIEKIEPADPGFVNFFLSRKFFKDSVRNIIKSGKKWGSSKEFDGKKIIFEYTDPNPFKQMHVGHLMSNSIGESISRIVEFSGAEVKRANYQGDVGLHVAKTLWGLHKLTLDVKIENLGKAYKEGSDAYKKNDLAQREINDINKRVYKKSDDIKENYEKGREISLKHFEEIYKKLGTRFDYYFFESETAGVGKRIVEENFKIGIFEESEEAIIFRGDLYGLHTRVFINFEGIPTYEAKELALSQMKYEEFPYDLSVIVTAEEQKEYFRVVRKAMEFINPELAAATQHISHGLMRLPSGKISSRSGEVPSGEELIQKVTDAASEKTERGGKSTANR